MIFQKNSIGYTVLFYIEIFQFVESAKVKRVYESREESTYRRKN